MNRILLMRWAVRAGVLTAGILLIGFTGTDEAIIGQDKPGLKLDPEKAFDFADADKDGKLTKEEFKKVLANSPRAKDKDPGKIADFLFDRLDENKDGKLTKDEFRKLGQLGPAGKGDGKGLPGKKDDPKTDPKGTAGNKSAPGSAFNDKPSAEQIAFFEKKIRPVLIEHCYKCHSAESEKIRGELVLDTRDGVRKGGSTGALIVPGDANKGTLVAALKSKDPDTAMPPKGKLSDAIVADFETWIRMGAPDPREGKSAVTKQTIDIEKGRTFWSFVKPKQVAPPPTKNTDWAKTEVDRYVLAGLEKAGLKPTNDADKRTLIRRVYLDLTGIPPTADEVEAFLADASPKAFEKVVDKLLASSAFGERWGRHWLDIARYAESSGKTANFNYPHAWRYRDYVIAAFNSDKPYDQFIKEQLAGDLMTTSDPKLKAERLIATGFLAIGPKTLNENNGLQFELDVVDEQIDTTTQAFLGLTVSCARCHDHKFDPIPQRDYYAMAGIFRSTETCYGTVRFVQSQRPSPLVPLPKDSGAPSAITENLSAAGRAALEKEIADLRKRIAESTDRLANIFPAAQLAVAESKLSSYDADGTPKLQAMAVRDRPASGRGGSPFSIPKGPAAGFVRRGGSTNIADSPVYTRGEPDKPSEDRVPRGTVQVLTTSKLSIPASTSGRLQLAEWIASKDNPLTARVMVNRVWLHLFGRGLVPTSDNFGAAGREPTHPELLDHLAIQFSSNGWSVKKLIKSVVMSRTYQLDSKNDPKAYEIDPDNALLWRMSPRRLDAESMRDSMLAVSGRLDRTAPVGSVVARAGEGPTTRPGIRSGSGITSATNDPNEKHRSVYLPIIRDNLSESLALFDGADPSLIVPERITTTVPAQGLFLLNNAFVITAAESASDALSQKTSTTTERIRTAYLEFFSRPPTDKEIAAAEAFMNSFKAKLPRGSADKQSRETWTAFCQALFASAEFQYRR